MYTHQSGKSEFLCAFVVAVLVMFMIPAVSGAPKDKNKDDAFTRVYDNTYDDVFQAAQEAIKRKGWFVTEKDKEKGTVTADNQGDRCRFIFELHFESVSPKPPETRVTINPNSKGAFCGKYIKSPVSALFVEIQKVLATYQ